MHNYYQKEIECMPCEELRALQNEKLVRQVRHVWENQPYYRKKMEEKGVTPDDIKSVDDLWKLPFMSKNDLRDTYPDGLLAVPRKDVVRIHSTSGTTGKRVIAYYTQGDLDLWRDCVARSLAAAGLTEEDTVQIAYGYGLFTGGLGAHDGSEKLGCMTIPMSTGNTERQLQFMEDLGATAIMCTPSYAEYIGEVVEEQGRKQNLKLRAGIFGAEAWSEEMRRDIEAKLGLKAYDIYGLTELSGPGVAYECEEQSGMHINEDHFLAEIVDPDTGEVLPEGSQGELVFTALDRKAFPLLRYRTHDICVLTQGACSCGRTFVKMCKPMGRSDDMLIVKGVNVFPSQIEQVLMEQGYPSNYQIILDRVHHSDTIEVRVEMTTDTFSDSLAEIAEREKKLVSELKEMLGIVVKVRLVAPKSIARSEGKAVRIIDNRKI
jgi:phenylacetate-CoA ligase